MNKSRYLWIAIVLIGIIPVLVLDILQHSLDWQSEVRGEIISVAYDNLSNVQKKEMLDRLFERNYTLIASVYIKGTAVLIALVVSFYCFSIYKNKSQPRMGKPIFLCAMSIVFFLAIKSFVINEINTNKKIKFLSFSPRENSFHDLYKKYFDGKVVYVDFWGTTCPPCLQEFRDFTGSLKNRYKSRQDLSYLYISEGSRYLWKNQIRKYNIEGEHIFLKLDEYENLFHKLTRDSAGEILIPRYLIINKNGEVAITDAKQPRDGDALYNQLDLYLNKKHD